MKYGRRRRCKTAGRWCASTATLSLIHIFHMPLVNGSYWAMVHGSNPEQVLQDAEGCAVMQELEENRRSRSAHRRRWHWPGKDGPRCPSHPLQIVP